MLLEVPWILRRYENQIGIIGACTSFKLLATPAAAAAADPIWVGASQRLVLSRLSASAASALDRFCNFKFESGMAVQLELLVGSMS